TRELFPRGLRHVEMADLRAEKEQQKPMDVPGTRVPSPLRERDRRAGLEDFDLVVAVDGYRVETPAQWSCVQSLRDDQTADFTVWRTRQRDFVRLQGPYPRPRYGPR
ncbi:MAG TPA: hypothetical protein VGL15_06310, partial [Vicinamibacteria bacterium]